MSGGWCRGVLAVAVAFGAVAGIGIDAADAETVLDRDSVVSPDPKVRADSMGQTPGLSIRRSRRGVVVGFHRRSGGAFAFLHGARVLVTCARVSRTRRRATDGEGPYAEIAHLRSRHPARIRSLHGLRADVCFLERVPRSDPFTQRERVAAWAARPRFARAFSPRGRRYLDELARSLAIAQLREAIEEHPAALDGRPHPPAQTLGSFLRQPVVALASPADTPRRGTIGLWLRGRDAYTLVIPTAAGDRLVYSRRGALVATNAITPAVFLDG